MKQKMEEQQATTYKLSREQVNKAIEYLNDSLGHFPYSRFDVREVYGDGELKSWEAILRIGTLPWVANYSIPLTDEDLIDMIGTVQKQLADRAYQGAELLVALVE